jgi:hypothetical protein
MNLLAGMLFVFLIAYGLFVYLSVRRKAASGGFFAACGVMMVGAGVLGVFGMLDRMVRHTDSPRLRHIQPPTASPEHQYTAYVHAYDDGTTITVTAEAQKEWADVGEGIAGFYDERSEWLTTQYYALLREKQARVASHNALATTNDTPHSVMPGNQNVVLLDGSIMVTQITMFDGVHVNIGPESANLSDLRDIDDDWDELTLSIDGVNVGSTNDVRDCVEPGNHSLQPGPAGDFYEFTKNFWLRPGTHRVLITGDVGLGADSNDRLQLIISPSPTGFWIDDESARIDLGGEINGRPTTILPVAEWPKINPAKTIFFSPP